MKVKNIMLSCHVNLHITVSSNSRIYQFNFWLHFLLMIYGALKFERFYIKLITPPIRLKLFQITIISDTINNLIIELRKKLLVKSLKYYKIFRLNLSLMYQSYSLK